MMMFVSEDNKMESEDSDTAENDVEALDGLNHDQISTIIRFVTFNDYVLILPESFSFNAQFLL